jgi:hypothetical protein
MREQIADHRHRRASATPEELARRRYPPSNPHRVGHYAGLHPEDLPYITGQDMEDDVPDSYYSQRVPTSARRYVTANGQQVIQQGNRRIVIHQEPPPRPKRHFHWLFWLGLGMVVMLAGWVLLSMAGTWWKNQQNTWSYGNPRTFQTDQNVGHGTASDPNSHFIAENLHGEIIVIEIPEDDPSKSKIYIGPKLYGDNAELTPVTLTFKDVNGSGKPAMIIHVQDQTIVFLNDGSQFKTPEH